MLKQIKFKTIKEFIIYLFTVIISLAFLFWGNQIATENSNVFNRDKNTPVMVSAKVISIIDKKERNLGKSVQFKSTQISFKAELLEGNDKGKIITVTQNIDSQIPLHGVTEVEPNDKVIIMQANIPSNTAPNITSDQISENPKWQFIEFIRTDGLLVLGSLFAILLILFGRSKGLNTIISLIFTCAAIFAVFIPAILSGKNIYLWAIIISFYTTIMTYLIINGYNKKSLCAAIGCFGGVLIAGLLTILMSKLLSLTGVVGEESIYLTKMKLDPPIDLKAIIFASIIIGALGAIMDVAMSIASALWELREKAKIISFKTLFTSGVNIGQDVMGTMTNTLILAYIGSSLSVALLLSAYNTSLLYLLNREMIIVEILQALIGSIGLLFTLPLTSLICGLVYEKKDTLHDQ